MTTAAAVDLASGRSHTVLFDSCGKACHTYTVSYSIVHVMVAQAVNKKVAVEGNLVIGPLC